MQEAVTEPCRDSVSTPQPLQTSPGAFSQQAAKATAFNLPDYTTQGPLTVQKLPKLEHTCIRCFPACQMNKCLLRVDVWYPKGGPAIGQTPPYPLAIFSSGFLVASELYQSYARRLTSWGYTVMLYDKMETAVDPVDDELSASFITELIDWAGSDPILKQVADPGRVYLIGHSRGAKIATLAAAKDTRVSAVCLVDPVDNTVYAPLGPGFPSAAAALRNVPESRSLPVAIVGGGLGGDCAPKGSNHDRFFSAAPGAAWEVVIADCGHFQFLDKQSIVQQAICGQGLAPDSTVRSITHSVMVAWGELATKTSLFEAPASSSAPPTGASTASASSASAMGGLGGADSPKGSKRTMNSLQQSISDKGNLDDANFTSEGGKGYSRAGDSENEFRGLGQNASRSCASVQISEGSEGSAAASVNILDADEDVLRSVSANNNISAVQRMSATMESSRNGYSSNRQGEWLSASSAASIHPGNGAARGGTGVQGRAIKADSNSDHPLQRNPQREGVAGAWHDVTRGVSEQAEEILRQAGPGPAGRPLEVTYRIKVP